MTPKDIRREGLKALAEKLGVVDMVRFLQQFERGEGSHTKDREKFLEDNSVDKLIEEIKVRRICRC